MKEIWLLLDSMGGEVLLIKEDDPRYPLAEEIKKLQMRVVSLKKDVTHAHRMWQYWYDKYWELKNRGR